MFSFAYPLNLLYLLILPALFLVYVWSRYWRRKALSRFGRPEELKELMPTVSAYKAPVKSLLSCWLFV